ncbi:SMI1/KNR4 family protein [Xenorhabdus bovienii]|uniref:SMI1/KNR4 family protein n=1 Tax=Xenorhabdus bovienii TaxID=40576 RepID=UPI0023B217F4|nr:SMI1/KNR4 family protein [Xenorhabdus bovienii]MDE9545566.1 SMI1/KNR4 family protein [Xenorhabdus bovienii]
MNYIDLIEKEMIASGEEILSSGGADIGTISEFESLLGVAFPESYKAFLQKYGTLAFGGDNYYGVTKKGINGDQAPCVLYVTKQARDAGDIDKGMIKIKSSGYGPSYSIDTNTIGKTGEAVVVETELSFKRDGVKNIIADSYAEFLLEEIREAIEDL